MKTKNNYYDKSNSDVIETYTPYYFNKYAHSNINQLC